MLNQIQFTYKKSAELLASISINQYGKFKILYEITPVLEWYGVLQDFTVTCFGHFLNFDSNTVVSSKVVHNLLAREIIDDGAGDSELYFGIGGHQLRFSKYEFCLLTGLKFGGQTHFSTYNNNISEGGVHDRYWPNSQVVVTTLQNRLCEQGTRFDHWEDPLKIALALFVKRFLFGADYKKIVSP